MRCSESQSGTDERTVAVTRARVRRWMLTEDSVRVAALAVSGGRVGLKQGFVGSSGHGGSDSRWETQGTASLGAQGTAGRGRM